MNIGNPLMNPVIRKPMFIGAAIAGAITLATMGVIGVVYRQEAVELLSALQRSTLYYGAAVTTSSATVLALVLTMLSLAYGSDQQANEETYVRFRAVAIFCVYSFIGGIALLLVISFPVEDFENISSNAYRYLFYALCLWNGVLCALLIAVILILRDAIDSIIGILSPNFDDD